MKLLLRATGCHFSYGITQVLSAATRHQWTHPTLTPARGQYSLLGLPTPEGWKTELT